MLEVVVLEVMSFGGCGVGGTEHPDPLFLEVMTFGGYDLGGNSHGCYGLGRFDTH